MEIPLLTPGPEKPLHWNEAALFRWSPSMDIFAVSDATEIFVVRLLSWERIWMVSTADWEGTVTSLSWKPDGRVLAAGCSDGTVKLVDLETSNVLHSFSTRAGGDQTPKDSDNTAFAVVNLCWREDTVSSSDSISTLVQDAGDFLNRIPPLAPLPQQKSSPTLFKQDSMLFTAMDSEEARVNTGFNLLVAVTRDGRVHRRLYGSLPLGESQLSSKPSSVLSTEISTDMSQIWILSTIETEDEPSKCQVVLDVLATGLDTSMRSELKMVADKAESLNGMLRYIEAVLKLMNEEQTKLKELSENNWKKFVEVIYDQGSNTNAEGELKHMLATGKRSESIELFLTQHIGERGVRQWEKQVDQLASGLKARVNECLKPALERLYIAASDFIGLSSDFRHRKARTGLRADPEVVKVALAVCRQLLLRAQALTATLEETNSGLIHLIRWLWLVLDDIVDTSETKPPVVYESQPIGNYLDHSFGRQDDEVSAFFEDGDAGPGLLELHKKLAATVASFFQNDGREAVLLPALCNVPIAVVDKDAARLRLAAAFLSEGSYQMAMIPDSKSTEITLMRLELWHGPKGRLDVNYCRLTLEHDSPNLDWDSGTGFKRIWWYGDETLCLSTTREDADSGDLLLLTGIGSPDFASAQVPLTMTTSPIVELVGDGAPVNELEEHLQSAIKIKCDTLIELNPARRLVGIIDAEAESFAYVDVEGDGSREEEQDVDED